MICCKEVVRLGRSIWIWDAGPAAGLCTLHGVFSDFGGGEGRGCLDGENSGSIRIFVSESFDNE